MRELIDVVEEMIEAIPETEKEFVAPLNDFKSSIAFAAPESIQMWWDEVNDWVLDYFGVVDDLSELEDWKQSVFNIWMEFRRQTMKPE